MADCPSKGLHLLDLPSEIRLLVYKQLFRGFTLELHHGGCLVPYDCNPDLAAHQICRTNKQIRQESIPILAASLKLICSPMLLSRSKGLAFSSAPSPQVVTPKLSPAFLAHVQSLSLSLESAYIPDVTRFPRLRKIVVDAWYAEPAVRRKKTDTDAELVRMACMQMDDTWAAPALYPCWLKDMYMNMLNTNVALAVQLVWKLEGGDPSKTHLKALIDLRETKIPHREEGGQSFEYCDTVPPQWLYD